MLIPKNIFRKFINCERKGDLKWHLTEVSNVSTVSNSSSDLSPTGITHETSSVPRSCRRTWSLLVRFLVTYRSVRTYTLCELARTIYHHLINIHKEPESLTANILFSLKKDRYPTPQKLSFICVYVCVLYCIYCKGLDYNWRERGWIETKNEWIKRKKGETVTWRERENEIERERDRER